MEEIRIGNRIYAYDASEKALFTKKEILVARKRYAQAKAKQEMEK